MHSACLHCSPGGTAQEDVDKGHADHSTTSLHQDRNSEGKLELIQR